jgi:hypothetical protein
MSDDNYASEEESGEQDVILFMYNTINITPTIFFSRSHVKFQNISFSKQVFRFVHRSSHKFHAFPLAE